VHDLPGGSGADGARGSALVAILISLKTVNTLGLTIAPAVLARADEIIE
jgi:hypothetical protein